MGIKERGDISKINAIDTDGYLLLTRSDCIKSLYFELAKEFSLFPLLSLSFPVL